MSSTRRANKRARLARRAENDAMRTARRDSLAVLLARLARGIAPTPDEAALLRATVEAEIRENDAARTSERGQQRAMEQQRQRVEAAETAIVEAEQRAAQAEAELTRSENAREALRNRAEAAAAAEERAKDAEAEREEMRSAYDRACKTIAAMHEAATGRTGEGPVRGVIEDVADMRARAVQAAADVEHMSRAHAEQQKMHDARRRDLADALGRNTGTSWPALVEHAAEAQQWATSAAVKADRKRADEAERKLSESETLGHRLLQRAERAEEELTAARAQLIKATRRGDIWKAKAHEIEADRDRLAAELEDAERSARQWEEQAKLHARAAEQADAVTAETKRNMERRTTTLRDRAQRAERRNADVRHYIENVYPGDIAEGVRVDLRRLLNGLPPTYGPSGQPEVITDRAAIRATLDEPEPCPCNGVCHQCDDSPCDDCTHEPDEPMPRVHTACAVLHTDAQGYAIPCPDETKQEPTR